MDIKIRTEQGHAGEGTMIIEMGKLAELGVMAASIIHELKQPLFGIKSYAQMILEILPPDEPIRKKVDSILKQCIVMEKILKDFRLFSRRSENVLTRMNVNDSVEMAVELLSHKLKKSRITLRMDLAPALPPIMGDPHQVGQIFVNLLDNAMDAVEGGREGFVGVRTLSRGGSVEAVIYDNGCGVSAETRKKIFQPFFTTKGPNKGTGLGLFIVREIMKAHSGRIEVVGEDDVTQETDAGARTAFRLVFPC